MNNNKSNKPKKLYTLIIIFIGILILSIIYANNQFVFLINEISVSGNKELTKNEVINISEINKGMNIFSTNIGNTINKLKDEPYIRYAFVSRTFPNKIVINILEREPVALISMDEIYSFDISGVLLSRPTKSTKNLPKITGIESVYKFEFGKSTIHAQIRQGVDIIGQINNSYKEIQDFISELHWDRKYKEWTIISKKYNPLIKLGADDFHSKLYALNSYLEQNHEDNKINKLKYIDLRFKNQLIVK